MVNLPNGLLASASNDKTIRIWNVTDSSFITYYINKGGLYSLAILKSGLLVSSDLLGNVLGHNLDGSFYTITSCPLSQNVYNNYGICVSVAYSCYAMSLIQLMDESLAFAFNQITTWFTGYNCQSCQNNGNFMMPLFDKTLLQNKTHYNDLVSKLKDANYSLKYESTSYSCYGSSLRNDIYTIIQLPNGNLASGGKVTLKKVNLN